MKKILYIALLVAEAFIDTAFLISLLNATLYIPAALAVAAVLGLLIWQAVRLSKAPNLEAKKKILRNIALILLIPIAVCFVTYVCVAIAFIIAFS